MKTIKILVLVGVLLLTGNSISFAKADSLSLRIATEKVTQDFQKLFKGMPFEEIICGTKECSLSICFKVDEKNEIEIVHVIGTNEKLVDYANKMFANKHIKADKYIFDQEVYWIKMVFQNRGF